MKLAAMPSSKRKTPPPLGFILDNRFYRYENLTPSSGANGILGAGESEGDRPQAEPPSRVQT
jgi:hypothetical protein